MQRSSSRSPVRWSLVAVFVVIGLVAAIAGNCSDFSAPPGRG
ncbi:hypothetical protein [Geodermatophilus sp. SYSU D01176]